MTVTRRRILLVVLALVVVLAGTSLAVRHARRSVPVVVADSCPPLLTHTSDALQDFADLLVWQGRTYVAVDQGPDVAAGEEVGRITCSIGEMDNPDGWAVAPLPWPDGTATGLATGTVLRSAGAHALLADGADGPVLYCEGDAGTADPPC